jgi:hypothetical protein
MAGQFEVGPIPPAPAVSLDTIRELLDRVTVTLVVNPADEQRIRAALEDLPHPPPLRVVTSDVLPAGKVATWSGDPVAELLARPIDLSTITSVMGEPVQFGEGDQP